MNKKGWIKILVNLGLLILFLLIVFLVLLNPNFWSKLADEFKNIFNPPETDPLPWQKEGWQAQKSALTEMTRVYDAFKKVKEATNSICFGAYKKININFFDKGFALHIYPGKDGNGNPGMAFMTYQYSKGNPDNEAQQKIDTWTPVSSELFLADVEPCLVYGQSQVKDFYTDFLDENPQWPLATGKVHEYGMTYDFWLSTKNKILISTQKEKPLSYSSGELNDDYYILKYNNKLCLIPSQAESVLTGLWSGGCTKPDDSSVLLDEDCLDKKNEWGRVERLPGLLKQEQMLADYVCKGFEYLTATG